MQADRRLYVDRDWSRLVEETDPAVAFLLAATGHEIPAEHVARLGLVAVDGRVEQAVLASEPVTVEPMAEDSSEPVTPILPPESRRTRRRVK